MKKTQLFLRETLLFIVFTLSTVTCYRYTLPPEIKFAPNFPKKKRVLKKNNNITFGSTGIKTTC